MTTDHPGRQRGEPRLRDKRVLVTGGAGFVGSHLAERLVGTNDVIVLDDCSNGTADHVPDAAAFLQGDVGDEALLEKATAGVDVVFHQAAQVSVERSLRAPVDSHETNVDATLALLELARTRDVRVVLASSCALYGHPTTLPVPETAKPDPTSPYGLEKLTVDYYAQLYADRYGLDVVPLRYFNVYGPRQGAGDYSGVISVFLEQARQGTPLTVHGDGTQTRDFVHVSDVVRANLLAATTDHTGEAFNVGTGRATSIRELAETVRDVTGADVPIVHTDPREGDVERSRADLSRARDRLGYRPTVDLQSGMETLHRAK